MLMGKENWLCCWLLVWLMGVISCNRPVVSLPQDHGAASFPVELTVDFQGKRENVTVQVDCRPGMTVFDLLEAAHGTNGLAYQARGSGEMAFVESIGGISNNGASGDNWIYRVNDQLGNQSCALYVLQPGDQVLWRYGEYK